MNHIITFFKIVLVTFVFLFNTLKLSAQVGNVDSAFQVARALAFSSKYDKSIDLCKKILVKTPNYQDVQVLLGRVYFWNGQTDSSVFTLTNSIAFKPYKDAYIALSDILRWENKPEEAQQIAENGILNFPDSEELYLRKIKAMYDQKKHKEAYRLSDSLAETNGNAEFRQFAEKIKNEMAKNSAGISYDFDYFDKQFKDPWHLVSLSYGRQTTYLGKITSRLNLANRFASNGCQFEMDAYPSLGKKMYLYLNAGISPGKIFPNYRAGFSIYRNLPHAFECELGFRVLYFNKATILYVGSIGKYAGNFWFSLRPTFIASENGNRFSQSYSFITRYYYGTTFDYMTVTLAYGLSPDDRSKETLFQNPNLKSFRTQLGIQKLITKSSILSFSFGLIRGEFVQGSKNSGNDFFTGIGYQKMF